MSSFVSPTVDKKKKKKKKKEITHVQSCIVFAQNWVHMNQQCALTPSLNNFELVYMFVAFWISECTRLAFLIAVYASQ